VLFDDLCTGSCSRPGLRGVSPWTVDGGDMGTVHRSNRKLRDVALDLNVSQTGGPAQGLETAGHWVSTERGSALLLPLADRLTFDQQCA
jgi:hypothetical protein